MADYTALDRTFWTLTQPPALVDAVSASANADASSPTVQIDLLVLAVSASANADASGATVLAGPGICRAAAQSASAQYQASPAGVVQQGAEITTIMAIPVVKTVLLGIQTASLFGPRVLITELASTPCSTVLQGHPWVLTQLASGPTSTTLYSSPQVI